MRYGSASSTELLLLCPPAFAQLQIHGLPVIDEPDPFAELGHVKHEFLADVHDLGDIDAALYLAPEASRAILSRFPIPEETLQRDAWGVEIAYGYDWQEETAREIGRRLNRRYGELGEFEIPGTSDMEGLAADGETVRILDFKTGFHRVTRARDNWQMRFLALAAARARGRTRARVEVVYVPPEEGEKIEHDAAEFDAFELGLVAAELRIYCNRVDAARESIRQHGYLGLEEVTTGPHCRRCPAYKVCPATAALLARCAEPASLEADFRALLRPETAPQAKRLHERIALLSERLGGDLKAYATVSPFETAPGVLYGPVAVGKDSIDGVLAWDALKREFGVEVADGAAEKRVTKRALRDALRVIAPRGQLASFERRALEVIGEAGGVTVKTHVEVKEHRAPTTPQGEQP